MKDTQNIIKSFKYHFRTPHCNKVKGKQGLDFVYVFCRELERQDKSIKGYLYGPTAFTKVDFRPDDQSEFFINYPLDVIRESARYFGLKIMCKKYISEDFQIIKGYRIFGDTLMITLWVEIWLGYLEKIKRYRFWLLMNTDKVSNYKNIRKPIRKEVENLNSIILQKLRCLSESNKDLNFKLERYIMEVENLDYKKYQGLPTYDHALTHSYHHKRVLL